MDLTTILTAAAAGQLLSPPTSKLLQSVGSFIGKAYEPRRLRQKGIAEREAIEGKSKAKAEAIRGEAEAKADAQLIEAIGKEKVVQMKERASARVENETLRRQYNRELITQQAAGFLPEEVSDQPVEEDWVAQFFEQCQNVSDSQMQSLWGQILAGEVVRPGRFSLRTLHAVKMLRKRDAELFTSYCQFVWDAMGEGPAFAVIADGDDTFWAQQRVKLLNTLYGHAGISGLRRIQLQDLNLITLKDSNLALNIRSHMGLPGTVSYQGQQYWIRRSDDNLLQLPVDFLTDIGRELAPIAGAQRNTDYERLVLEQIDAWGFEVSTSCPGRDVPTSTA